MQRILIDYATGDSAENEEYEKLRKKLLADPSTKNDLPGVVENYRSLDAFWDFIRDEFDTYKERRKYLRKEFVPLLNQLEKQSSSFPYQGVTKSIEQLNSAEVKTRWGRCLQRIDSDPEGAITAARSLVESVCKHILDDVDADYSRKDNLPQLYGKTIEELSLAPNQYKEEIFKQILGGCKAAVGGLAGLRNHFGDAHGSGANPVKPQPRHARLAVNTAGSIVVFLTDTRKERE